MICFVENLQLFIGKKQLIPAPPILS